MAWSRNRKRVNKEQKGEKRQEKVLQMFRKEISKNKGIDTSKKKIDQFHPRLLFLGWYSCERIGFIETWIVGIY